MLHSILYSMIIDYKLLQSISFKILHVGGLAYSLCSTTKEYWPIKPKKLFKMNFLALRKNSGWQTIYNIYTCIYSSYCAQQSCWLFFFTKSKFLTKFPNFFYFFRRATCTVLLLTNIYPHTFFLPRTKMYAQYIYTRFYKTHKNTQFYTTSQVISHISWLINKNKREIHNHASKSLEWFSCDKIVKN